MGNPSLVKCIWEIRIQTKIRRRNDAGFHNTFKDDAKIATCLGLYPALLPPMRGEHDPTTHQHKGRYSLLMVFLQCCGLQGALADAY
jgi:hypothetical protein